MHHRMLDILQNHGVLDDKVISFGTDLDATIGWDSSNIVLEVLPKTDDTGALNIGDGTTDMDMKWFAGATTKYVEFNVGDADVNFVGVKLDFELTTAAVTSEEHAVDIDYTGVCSSGDAMVGLDIAVTPTGTAATWASGIFAKVTQGSTKAVNGYLSGAEIEVVNGADNVSDWFVLVLNAQNNGAQQGSHSSYIALRDYGSLDIASLMWVSTDHTIATTDGTKLISTSGGQTHTHSIRFIAGSTVLYLMATNTGA